MIKNVVFNFAEDSNRFLKLIHWYFSFLLPVLNGIKIVKSYRLLVWHVRNVCCCLLSILEHQISIKIYERMNARQFMQTYLECRPRIEEGWRLQNWAIKCSDGEQLEEVYDGGRLKTNLFVFYANVGTWKFITWNNANMKTSHFDAQRELEMYLTRKSTCHCMSSLDNSQNLILPVEEHLLCRNSHHMSRYGAISERFVCSMVKTIGNWLQLQALEYEPHYEACCFSTQYS